MSDSEYVDTEVAECPNCGDLVPGHVRGDSFAGVYSWGCPGCGYSCEPTNLNQTVSVSDLLKQYDPETTE